MPSVEAQVTVKLDASALVDALLGDLRSIGDRLGELDVAVSAGDLEAGASLGAGFDLSSVESALGELASSLTAELGVLPSVSGVLQPIEKGLELAQALGADEFRAGLEALCQEVVGILEGEKEGGLLACLIRAFDLAAAAPETRSTLELLRCLAGDAVADATGPVACVGDLLPAFRGVIDRLAALMALESALSEAERLSAKMPPLIDADGLRQRATVLCQRIEAADLIPRAERLGELGGEGRETFLRSVEAVGDELASLGEDLATGMAFGEGTLAYLDLERLQADVAAAAALLRQGEPAAMAVLLEKVMPLASPLLELDLGLAPVRSLDAMLSALEGQRSEIVGGIDSLDPAELMGPVGEGLAALTEIADTLQEGLAEMTIAVETAARSVVGVVEALPLDDLARAIEDAVAPVAAALGQVRELVAGASAAVESTAGQAEQVLADLEGLLDAFLESVRTLFGEARQVVEGLGIDAVIGGVAEQIQAFADLLAQAEMKPVFDGAVVTIDSTADVVGAVPLALLPAAAKAELDTVTAPVKGTDARLVQVDLKALLGLREDGTFALRDELEAAVAEVQAVFEALIQALADLDPRQHLAGLDSELAQLAGKIEGLSPQLGLEPLQLAIDTLKKAVEPLDLDPLLAPVEEAFSTAISALEGYSPAQLLEPVEARLAALRQALSQDLDLAAAKESLEEVRGRAVKLAAHLDPEPLRPRILTALGELQTLVAQTPRIPLTGWLGTLLPALSSTGELRIFPWTFATVATWLGEVDGQAHLEARSARLGEALEETLVRVRALEIAPLTAELARKCEGIRAALASAGATDPRVAHAAGRLDLASLFGPLEGNRQRFRTELESAALVAGALASQGLSEVRETVEEVRAAFAPLAPLRDFLRRLLLQIGLEGIEDGVAGVLRQVFSVASPERLVDLFLPIAAALQRRAVSLIDALLDPLSATLDTLMATLDSLDLDAVRQGLEAIVEAAVAEVRALDPSVFLALPLGALQNLRQEVLDFDPLQPIQAVLKALQDTLTRVLGMLSAERLLEDPVAIYDHVLAQLAQLDVEVLLQPVLLQLDAIALAIDLGLEDTVTAFERLQDALPEPGGGLSVSVSVDVGFG